MSIAKSKNGSLTIPAFQERVRTNPLNPITGCTGFRTQSFVFFYQYNSCMGNLLSLGAKMCIWNLTEGRSRNCDFKCKLGTGTYFCGFGLYSCNAILHAMCFQFCLHRDIHKKCIPILI